MNQRAEYLIGQFMEGKLSAEETAELTQMVETEDLRNAIREQLSRFSGTQENQEQILQNISQRVLQTDSVQPVHFLRTAWLKYAAAAALIISIGIIFYTQNTKEGAPQANNKPAQQTPINPGGDKAVLTLADGSQIILDSATNGNLANQGGVQVVKLADGRLSYNAAANSGNENLLNTLKTPRGGQYKLTLPDGTNVWLNAASSITYPVTFNGNQRSVKITGEAYFEVAKMPAKPFVVDVDTRGEVEVLGTHFNINAYTEEPAIRTTLLEGKVRVHKGTATTILKPGQQAVMADGVTVNNSPNIGQVMAWKNGAFGFDNVDVNVVLRQLARWYDIELVYPNGKPQKTIWGKIGRNLTLQQVVEVLNNLGLPCTIKERTLIIPN